MSVKTLLCSSILHLLPKKQFNWPAPPSIHRGLEWPQSLNRFFVCLLDCSLFGSKSSNFSSPHLLLYRLSPLLLARSLEYPQRIRVVSVFEPSDCLIVCIRCEFISIHPALHRNGGWAAAPGVTSERRLEGLCIHFLICCLLSVCNIFTTPRAGP